VKTFTTLALKVVVKILGAKLAISHATAKLTKDAGVLQYLL